VANSTLKDMSMPEALDETLVEFPDNRLLIELCGQFDRNLVAFEQGYGVVIMRRGNRLALHGPGDQRERAVSGLEALYQRLDSGRRIEPGDIEAVIRLGVSTEDGTEAATAHQIGMVPGEQIQIHTKKRVIEPRSHTQRVYVADLFSREMVFGIGPAGTGKTYLAVAAAVSMFFEQKVDRIILSRPAVEAGERLGFLPGDMKDKIDPYLRPLYDALYEMLGFEKVGRLIERNVIEVAPLAYMRGRTLNNSFIILDESQNTTCSQMKMFLTRIGFGSTVVITGDVTQVDLPRGEQSGLKNVVEVLARIDGISFTNFHSKDVVRHPLVQKIVDAYANYSPPAKGSDSDRHAS